MAKTSVQFYYDYIEQLEDLDDKQFRNVVLAMVKYDGENEIIKLDKTCKIAFNFIKKRIDYDKESYNTICERNRENGKKGGRPKNPSKPTKPNGLFGNPEKPKKPELELELELDKELDNTTTNTIYDYLEQNFGRTLSPLEYEEVAEWEDNELTRYAIKLAVLNGVYKIKYISSILNDYKKNNITTVQQAQMAEEQFRKNKNKPKEKVPEWFNKEIEKEKTTEKEQEDLEIMLKDFR